MKIQQISLGFGIGFIFGFLFLHGLVSWEHIAVFLLGINISPTDVGAIIAILTAVYTAAQEYRHKNLHGTLKIPKKTKALENENKPTLSQEQ